MKRLPRSASPWVLRAAWLVALCTCASGALAQEGGRTAALAWARSEGAEGCIGAPELSRAIEARLGRPVLAEPAGADVAIEGSIAPADGGFRVRLVVRGRDGAVLGRRALDVEGPDCRAADEPVELVIALMIDPDARNGPPAPADGRPPPSPPRPQLAPEPRPPVAPEPARAWTFGVGAAVAVAVGLAGDPAIGVSVAISAAPTDAWELELELVGFLPAQAGRASRGVSLAEGAVGLAVCPWLWRGGGVGLAACGGARAGLVLAEGFGFDVEETQTETLLDLALEGVLEVAVGRAAAVRLGVAASLPLLRPRFVFEDASGLAHPVYRRPPFAAIGRAGLHLRFP